MPLDCFNVPSCSGVRKSGNWGPIVLARANVGRVGGAVTDEGPARPDWDRGGTVF
jgi:hypothetical protein